MALNISQLQDKIEQITGEIEGLRPASTEEMHARAMLGESAQKMIAANSKLAETKAALEIDLGVAHAQLSSANKAAAQPRIEALLATRTDAITAAQNALRGALDGEQMIATALAAYTTAAQAACDAGNDANQVARQAGLGEQVERPQLGQEVGNQLRQSLPLLVSGLTGPQILCFVIGAATHE
jgi:hypothetical protein